MSTTSYDVVALLSGGLDSILAARLVQDQGLKVKCLHFVTPFFGKPQTIARWQKIYGLDIVAVDVGDEFAAMLAARPVHGFGKVLNPCIDCKILMLRRARLLMAEYGAKAIVTGEVLGQRPMSQRRDCLNVIRRDAGVRDLLVRPLCAKLLEETEAEVSGLIDRSKLKAFSGRGRKDQLALAVELGIKDIPTPAGGCRLTEVENARSYWPVLIHAEKPTGGDFALANTGRQYWSFAHTPPLWICIGRNLADNDSLLSLARPGDIAFKTASFPGPLSLARPLPGQVWDDGTIRAAAAFCASFSPKAVRHHAEHGSPVTVRIQRGPDFASLVRHDQEQTALAVEVVPDRTTDLAWQEYPWEQAKEQIRAEARERMGHGS